MIYLICFRPSSNAYNKVMPVVADSKQDAVDIARRYYGESIASVVANNEVNKGFDTIPWGTEITYKEYDEHQTLLRTLTYPKL